MQGFGLRKVALVLVVAILSQCAASNAQNLITLSSLIANNTSASDTMAGPLKASNTSKLPIERLTAMPPNTMIAAWLMLWWGDAGHPDIGYSSSSPSQISRQFDDMLSRGVRTVALEWRGTAHTFENNSALAVKQQAELRGGTVKFLIVDDLTERFSQATLDATLQALSQDITYIESTFAASPAYLSIGGRPVIIVKTEYPLKATALPQTVQAAPSSPLLLFFAKYYPQPVPVVRGGDLADEGSDAIHPKLRDEPVAPPPPNPDAQADISTGPGCGEKWLTAPGVETHTSAGTVAPLRLVAWNNYEANDAIEPGIPNCGSITASVADNTLSWQFSGNIGSVDHFTIYVSSDGSSLIPVAEAKSNVRSIKFASGDSQSSSYVMYVQAVGRPSFQNQLSAPVQYTASSSPGFGNGTDTVSIGPPTAAPADTGQSVVVAPQLALAGGATATAEMAAIQGADSVNLTGIVAAVGAPYGDSSTGRFAIAGYAKTNNPGTVAVGGQFQGRALRPGTSAFGINAIASDWDASATGDGGTYLQAIEADTQPGSDARNYAVICGVCSNLFAPRDGNFGNAFGANKTTDLPGKWSVAFSSGDGSADVALRAGLRSSVPGSQSQSLAFVYTNRRNTEAYKSVWVDNSGDLNTDADLVAPSLTLRGGIQQACTATNRGQLSYQAGKKGVKDTVAMCLKDANDTYGWRSIF